jgi:serine/threonine protein kinase/tetratricopeptide (TPR) repeat protein
MTPERWQQIRDVLEEAQELEPAQRSAFLDRACFSDQVLRQEVEALLAASDEAHSTFLASPPASDGLIANLDGFFSGGGLQAGQVFAERFQLLRRLGEGGMGQVWLAEQTFPVRRQVAIKLIKAGMYDEAVVQRFESERQSLAIMDHPAIAKVFDAGATPQGQPYFVMEYVPGLPITEYCDQKKLKIADRLELFIQACEGVQHAHQKAIIHRDLKPANILVVEVDGKPVPRIIDFGLAKATTSQVEGESRFTQMGHFVGTPGYMSPEQAGSGLNGGGQDGVHDIDTRTDVYSLGVVLYVLLAGLQPFETKSGQKQPLDELLRKLREEEPPSPSQKVSADRDTSAATAASRGTEPTHLVSLLRGDLDWITMKALEKDRVRRYGSPSELAADIRHYLNHEPVVARPASTGYRLRKYTRRHRVAVLVAAGLVLLLAAFSILQARQLRRITSERDRANRERDHATRERDRATRITDFMTGMFKVSDPSEARGNRVTAREILDKASIDMGKGLAKDPEVQSQMMQVMASTYLNLGLYPRAHELAQRALDARLNLLGPDDPKTLESMTQLGLILFRDGHYPEGEKLEQQALAGERRILGPEDPLTLQTMANLAYIVQGLGNFDVGEKLAREVVEIETRRLGPESALVLQSTRNLNVALFNQGRYAEAERKSRQLLDVERRVLGPDHPDTLHAMDDLANAIEEQGRLAEAEQAYRDALAAYQRVLGPEHPTTALVMSNLAVILTAEGRLADSEKLTREAFAIELRAVGPENAYTLLFKSNLADVLLKEGHIQEAEKLQREALEAMARTLGPEYPGTLACQTALAGVLNREGRYAEAEKLARGAFEVEIRSLGPQSAYTLDALRKLGIALAHSGRYGEASKLFHDVIAKGESSAGKGNSWSAWYDFACVAAAANRPDDALKYLQEAIHRGYKNADSLMSDDDLKNLRPNSKFQQLVAELKLPPARDQKAQTQ